MNKLRRSDRALNDDGAKRILLLSEYGALAMVTPENTPYQVPVNYVYVTEENAIYIHGAVKGRKIDCLLNNANVCFSAVLSSNVIEGFTTLYESAFAFGTAEIMSDEQEKVNALVLLSKKYYPDVDIDELNTYIKKHLKNTAVIKVTVKSISGKAHKT